MLPPKHRAPLPDSEQKGQASIGDRIERRVTTIASGMQAQTRPTGKGDHSLSC